MDDNAAIVDEGMELLTSRCLSLKTLNPKLIEATSLARSTHPLNGAAVVLYTLMCPCQIS